MFMFLQENWLAVVLITIVVLLFICNQFGGEMFSPLNEIYESPDLTDVPEQPEFNAKKEYDQLVAPTMKDRQDSVIGSGCKLEAQKYDDLRKQMMNSENAVSVNENHLPSLGRMVFSEY